MKITIVGAGNIGTQFAVHCAEKGHDVTIYSSRSKEVKNDLVVVNENNEIIHSGHINTITNDVLLACRKTKLFFITVPSFCMEDIAAKFQPYIEENSIICLVPGTGGGECSFKYALEKKCLICGMQRVPSVARLVEYGKAVRAIGYREELYVGALPNDGTEVCCNIIAQIFDIKCSPLPNYLNLTLTPSNPILHTTRLKVLFGDYNNGKVYKDVPLFYEDWNNETSELLFKCDDEVQNICKALIKYDLSFVKSLKIHYESTSERALTRKIRSITGFKGLSSPTIKTDYGYIPDFSSRYFTADFSYGLSILVQIADLFNVDVPNMKEVLDWYYTLVRTHKSFSYRENGIANIDDFDRFYSK